MAAKKNPPSESGNSESAPSVGVASPKKTPREWLRALSANTAKHAAAAVLHGWGEHEHHLQKEPLLLSQDDYKQALECAAKFPCAAPHEPALAKLESVRAKFKGFEPAKASEKKSAPAPKRGGPRPQTEKEG